MERIILHSDLNACYASIEELHHPELRGKPLAVGGDVEQRHGIILAKNQAAKARGVQTGQAIWEAKQQCPGLHILPHSFDLYWRFCKRAREIYGEYADRVEPFGIDEAWLDLTGCVKDIKDGVAVAHELRRRMKEELGLTVSVGVRDSGQRRYERQTKLPRPTSLSDDLCEGAMALLAEHHNWRGSPIRSLELRACELVDAQSAVLQTNLFENEERRQRREALAETVDRLRLRFGRDALRRGVTMTDELGSFDPRGHTIHPVSFF